MAGYVWCILFRTPTAYLTSGHGAADSSFPHANAADITHPHRPWKSAATITAFSTFYGCDFGTAVSMEGVAIDNTNVTSVSIEAADDDAFTTNKKAVTVAVGANQVERGLFKYGYLPWGRQKAFLSTSGTDLGGISRRYWRIVARGGSIDDAEPQFVIGSVAWCQTLTGWNSGTSSYGEQPIEATRPNDDFAGGGAEPVILGNPYAAITLSATPADRDTMRSVLFAVLLQGIGRPFLFYKNDGNTADFYLCRRRGDVTVKQTSPTTIEFNEFILASMV